MLNLIDDNLNQEALEEFIQHREELKKPMTPLAIKKAIKVLLQYPPDHQQFLVDTAIMCGWRGIFHRDMPERSTRSISLQEQLTDTSWADGFVRSVDTTPKLQ